MPGTPSCPHREKRGSIRPVVVAVAVACAAVLPAVACHAGGTLKISTSSQVYEAFDGQGLDDFRKENRVEVDVDVLTSEAALARLVHGFSDVAATAQRIDSRMEEQGYVEIPFCTDDIAVVVNAQVTVTNVTEAQLRGIFSGDVTNWKQLGGPDQRLIVVVPSRQSAAFQNFSRMVMQGYDMEFDLLATESTMVSEVIRRIPWSMTFVAHSAIYGKPLGVKVVRINDLAPGDASYPYEQTFSLVTRGKPEGTVKKFVKYIQSRDVQKIIRERGMRPISD